MPTNTITLVQAKSWAKRWNTTAPSNKTKAYLIPQEDITQLMQEAGVVNVRAYNGIDDTGVYKLMLVGVDANGKDMVDEANGQYVYDFTQPCPKVCDTTSPLFNP